jgi:cell division protein FtsL
MSVYVPSHIRAARRMTAFILFIIGVGLTVTLYYVKTNAQSSKRQLVKLERQISTEDAAVRVLKAEIAYLENPARLNELSQTQLGLEPIKAERVITQADIAKQFPLREPAE